MLFRKAEQMGFIARRSSCACSPLLLPSTKKCMLLSILGGGYAWIENRNRFRDIFDKPTVFVFLVYSLFCSTAGSRLLCAAVSSGLPAHCLGLTPFDLGVVPP